MSFSSEGLLTTGEFAGTLDELSTSLLVLGPSDSPSLDWDKAWRFRLVVNLGILAKQLWRVKAGPIFLDGSFVESKGHPNDIDGYFECDLAELASGRLEESLNRLDEYKIWTWDPAARSPYRGYPKRQLPMWHRYRIELYPHYGQGTGVRDDFGHEFEFPSLFRQHRETGRPKGIVVLLPTKEEL